MGGVWSLPFYRGEPGSRVAEVDRWRAGVAEVDRWRAGIAEVRGGEPRLEEVFVESLNVFGN